MTYETITSGTVILKRISARQIYHQCMYDFDQNPSGENYAELEKAMLVHQDCQKNWKRVYNGKKATNEYYHL